MSALAGSRRRWPALAGLLALAAALRLVGLRWGFPFLFHDGEWALGERVLQAFRSGDLNPHWFRLPSLTFYLHLLASSGLALARGLGGADPAVPRTLFYLAGRLISAGLGTAGVAVVYELGRRLAGTRAALAGGLLAAVSFQAVQNAHYATADVPFAFFVLAAVLAAWRAAERAARGRDYIVAGALAGLALATSYIPLVLLPLLAAVLTGSGRFALRARALALALAAAGLALALAMPYAWSDRGALGNDLRLEIEQQRSGHFDFEEPNKAAYYGRTLAVDLGTAGLVLGLAGLALGAWRYRARWLIVAAYPAALWALLLAARVSFARQLVSLVPFLALAGGLALDAGLAQLARAPGLRRPQARPILYGLALAAGLAVAAGPLWRAGAYSLGLRGQQTYTALGETFDRIACRYPWLQRALIYSYIQPPGKQECLQIAGDAFTMRQPVWIRDQKIRFLVIDEWLYQQRRRVPGWEEYFAGLERDFALIDVIEGQYPRFWSPEGRRSGSDARPGPTLWIYQRRANSARSLE